MDIIYVARQHALEHAVRDVDLTFLSVRPSVRPSVCSSVCL